MSKYKYKIRLRLQILIILLFVGANSVFSQQITVTGTVLDDALLPLPGVSVVESGTLNGTITDNNGAYTINTSKGSGLLVFSFIGFINQEVQINNQNVINVTLKTDIINLDDVVVVGYTTERKADLTGSVSVVNVEELEELPSGNIIKSIQGRVPGVFVTTDGSPGSGATVRIRGTGTLNNNDPLYVVDGVPTKGGMHEINANDIESFQILKDASAASIYGSRAANGVIIITTKRAKEGETRINFDVSHSLQKYTTKLEPLNTYERGLVYWQASINDRLNPVSPIYKYSWNGDFNNPILGAITYPEYIDSDKTMKPADTKWFDEISRPALLQSYNVDVSKGDKNSKMLFSIGFYDHKGVVKETDFKRMNVRFNSEFSLLKDKVRVGENFTMSYQNEVLIDASNVQFSSLVQHPIVPVYTEDGGWGGPVSGMTDRQNPVRLIEDYKQNKYNYARPFGNFYIEVEPINKLKFKSNVGVDYSLYYSRQLYKSYQSGFLSEPENKIQNNTSIKGNWIWTNTATYDLESGANRLNFLAGMEQTKYNEEWFDASRQGLEMENMDYAYLNSGTKNMLNGGLGSSWALQSFFGKINYSYAFKYLASVTVRRDGSSRFGINNKYGNFPAFSLGWRISEEQFMKSLVSIPFELKLRASWGKNGNQEINNLARYNIYRTIYGKEDPIWDNPTPPSYMPNLGTAYDIAGVDQGQLPSGFITNQIANEDLKWESTTQTNFGFDFTIMENFSGSIDYFNKYTEDILYYRMLISAVGEANGQYVNGGSIANKGFEFLLGYSNNFREFNFDISANMDIIKNEVVDMPDDITIQMPLTGIIPAEAKQELPSSMVIGHSINSIYGYVADGLFQNQNEVDEHAQQPGKGVGRIRYADISGPEGVSDGIVDNYDQKFIAVADPDFTYGLNLRVDYKKFNLDLFIQGIQGVEVYNNYKTYTDFASLWPGTNWGKRTLNSWTPENSSSTIPKLTTIDGNNEGRLSTYFIENGSYVKLRNIQIGYNFTPKDAKISTIKTIKVFIQGQNLLTFKSKDFSGPDPENPSYAFPIPAIYTFGVKLGL